MALYEVKRAPSRTQGTIVLDIDETLLHTGGTDCDTFISILRDKASLPYRKRIYHINGVDAQGHEYDLHGFIRPGAHEFLKFCFEYFAKVIIWSAGQRYYVYNAVLNLFKDLPMPDAVWTYDDVEFTNKGYVYKPLSKLAKHFKLDLDTMYVVDDRQETFKDNKDNAIHIPPYKPTLSISGLKEKDDALVKIMTFLDENETTKAVLTKKDNIFA